MGHDGTVHDSDRETWTAIDHGQRVIDWAAWFGNPSGTDYLTAVGKAVAQRATSDLETFFGAGWLHRAMQVPIRGLGRFSPSLAPAAQFRPGAFIEAIRWWAGLQFLVEVHAPGIARVQDDARSDVTEDRFLHTLTQARLAVAGSYLGAMAALEPVKAVGGPGDVLLTRRSGTVFIEVVTFSQDGIFSHEDEEFQRHMMHLIKLELEYLVYWEGDVPGFLPTAHSEAWILETSKAAARCADIGDSVLVPAAGGGQLIVHPGAAPAGTTRIGPYVERDQGQRLAQVIDRKGAKTRGAGIAWIWVEDHGGLYPFTQFADLSLAAKVDAMADLVRPILQDRPHIGGVVVSTAARRHYPLPPDEQVYAFSGMGLKRGLPIDRVRETVIITKDVVLPDQTRFVWQVCDREPRWLDWALARLGFTGGTDALLSSRA